MSEDNHSAITALVYALVAYRDAEYLYGDTPEESKARWADVLAYPAIEAALEYIKAKNNPPKGKKSW